MYVKNFVASAVMRRGESDSESLSGVCRKEAVERASDVSESDSANFVRSFVSCSRSYVPNIGALYQAEVYVAVCGASAGILFHATRSFQGASKSAKIKVA